MTEGRLSRGVLWGDRVLVLWIRKPSEPWAAVVLQEGSSVGLLSHADVVPFAMALPRRCAASLRLGGEDPAKLGRSLTANWGRRPRELKGARRQVVDLPRIGVAEPLAKKPQEFCLDFSHYRA
jgi:hypothetical protein